MDSKQCADLVTMFVEMLQNEWQSKYDLLESTWQSKYDMLRESKYDLLRQVQELKLQNKELREKLEVAEQEGTHTGTDDASLRQWCRDNWFLELGVEDAESEEQDNDTDLEQEIEDPEPDIIESVPSLMD